MRGRSNARLARRQTCVERGPILKFLRQAFVEDLMEKEDDLSEKRNVLFVPIKASHSLTC